MRYCFRCQKCQATVVVNLPVAERNTPIGCPDCSGIMLRDMRSEIQGKRIITWKYWSDSTGYDFGATKEERAAMDKRLESFKPPVDHKRPAEVLRELTGAR